MRLAAPRVCARCCLARTTALLRTGATTPSRTMTATTTTPTTTPIPSTPAWRRSAASAASTATAAKPPPSSRPTPADRRPRQAQQPRQRQQRHQQPTWDSVAGPADLYDKVLQLDGLPEERIVPFVREHFWQSVRGARGGRPGVVLQKQLRDSVAAALLRVVHAKACRPANPGLPGMVLVSQMLAPFERSLLPRLRMMLGALEVLAGVDASNPTATETTAATTATTETTATASPTSIDLPALAQDVVDLWKHMTTLNTEMAELGAPLRWALPPSITTTATAPAKDRRRRAARRQLGDEYATALQSIFPASRLNLPLNEVHRRLMAALMGTLVLFRGDGPGKRGDIDDMQAEVETESGPPPLPLAQTDAQPLCGRAHQLVVSLGLVFSDMEHYFDEHPQLGGVVRERLRLLGAGGGSTAADAARPLDQSLVWLKRRIRKASKSWNMVEVEDAWHEFEGLLRQTGLDAARTHDGVLGYIDLAAGIACAHRRLSLRDRILAVLAEMGLAPTVKTYTEMITSFKQARMPELMMRQWDEAVRSGVRFDTHIWSAWISGLIECGIPRRGLLALRQMAELWEAQGNATTDDGIPTSPQAVEPNITAVNAAVTGLLRTRRADAVRELLAWAARKGIRPDIVTYNSLLERLLRADDRDTAEQLVALMRSEGVEPDVSTYSVIIHANLTRAAATASAAEQAVTVRGIFARMEADGVPPNAIVYADVIKALIVGAPHGPGADEAIDEVKAHMRLYGVAQTPHILTMLAQRELDRDPPDLAMILELAARRSHTWLGQMDTIFWERIMIVLAHADCHSVRLVDEAVAVFGWLHAGGRTVTLSAKKALLDALLAQGRVEDGRAVVRAAVEDEAAEVKGVGSAAPRRNHGFWALAMDEGLLE